MSARVVAPHPRSAASFANKQDLPGAVSEVDVAMRFNLDSLAKSRHSVVKCIARADANNGTIDERIEQGRWLSPGAAAAASTPHT